VPLSPVRLARRPVRRISFVDGLDDCGPSTNLATTNWSDPVASVCDVCGKGPGFGNNVSFSHRRTPRRWNPNIQRRRVMVGKTPKRLYVCTSCIKAGKIAR
jgi:large subunit ribosomal protein L28